MTTTQLKSYYDQLPVKILVSENGVIVGDDCHSKIIPCMHTVSVDGEIYLLYSEQILELIQTRNLRVSDETLNHFKDSVDNFDNSSRFD